MTFASVRGPFQGAIDFEALKSIANPRAGDILARYILLDPKKKAGRDGEIWFVNTHRGEKGGGSFSFSISKGVGHDFADPRYSGDLLELVGMFEGHNDVLRAARSIAEFLGIEMPMKAAGPARPSGRIYSRRDEPQRDQNAAGASSNHEARQPGPARIVWRKRLPIEGSVAEAYLLGRHLELPARHDSLAYADALVYNHPSPDKEGLVPLGCHPALLAGLTCADNGAVIAAHRIYLHQDVEGCVTKLKAEHLATHAAERGIDLPTKFGAKKTIGNMEDAAVFLGTPAERLIIVEGVETALAASLVVYAAATCGSGRFGKIAIPAGVREIVIVPDRDADGISTIRDHALAAAESYRAKGYVVRVAEVPAEFGAKADLADVIANGGTVDDVQAIIDQAIDTGAPADTASSADEAPRPEGTDGIGVVDDLDLPPFPSELLSDPPGALGDLACYLRDIDPSRDEVRALAMALSGIAAIASGAYVLPWSRFKTHTDLFIVSVDISGAGKSTVLKSLTSILQRACAQRAPLHRLGGLASAEGFWDRITQTTSDHGLCTAVFIIDEFGDELKSIVQINSYKYQILRIFRDLTNSGDIQIEAPPTSKRTGTPRANLPYPVISFLGLTTRHQFIEPLRNELLAANGTEGRLLVLPSRGTRLWEEIDDVQLAEPEALGKNLEAIHLVASAMRRRGSADQPQRLPVQMEPSARRLLQAYYKQQEREAQLSDIASDELSRRWAPMIRRRVEHAVKLAMLWAISEKPDAPMVKVCGLEWGLKIVHFKEAAMRALHGAHFTRDDRSRNSAELRRRIFDAVKRSHTKQCRRKDYIGVPARDVMRNLDLNRQELRMEANALIEQGRLLAFDKTEQPVHEILDKGQQTFLKPGS